MITKLQQKLDKEKWNKSVEIGRDACGTFDFCIKCDKEKENPCAKAYTLFHKKKCIKPTAKKIKK